MIEVLRSFHGRPSARAAMLALGSIATLAACGGASDEGGAGGAMAADTAGGAMMAESTPADSLTIDGFQTPESVLWDSVADVYLVSNINGQPLDRDDNGFISRVRPDGSIESLKWIDAASDSVTLNAPKGLAIHGDTIFVTDIDSVRAFDRNSGAPLGAMAVPGATFLNDADVGPDGTLYVTDSGLNASFGSTGTDAVYRFSGGRAQAVAHGAALKGPNGVLVDGDSLVLVPFADSTVMRVASAVGANPSPSAGASPSIGTALPHGQLDGVVKLPDGSLLVSSWSGQAVYRIPAGGGAPTTAVSGTPSPADIGWDSKRSRVLIPIFQGNRVEVRTVR